MLIGERSPPRGKGCFMQDVNVWTNFVQVGNSLYWGSIFERLWLSYNPMTIRISEYGKGIWKGFIK